MLKVYGIPNCQSVKKALAHLRETGVEHEFVNFRKTPLTQDKIDAWLATVGAETLVNRRGTSWRTLTPEEKLAAENADTLCALLLEKPTLIKRPVVEWPDGRITTGLDAVLVAEARS